MISGEYKETSIFTTAQRTALRLPPSDVAFTLAQHDKPFIPVTVSDLAPTVIVRFDKLGLRITDDPIYRLMDATFGGPLQLEFSLSSFASYRFTSGLLDDELKDSLALHHGNIAAILKDRKTTLPIREAR